MRGRRSRRANSCRGLRIQERRFVLIGIEGRDALDPFGQWDRGGMRFQSAPQLGIGLLQRQAFDQIRLTQALEISMPWRSRSFSAARVGPKSA